MNEALETTDSAHEHRALRERLRDAGIGLVGCATDGAVQWAPPAGRDRLGDLCCGSAPIREAIDRHVGAWNDGRLDPIEALPGAWLIPMAVQARRRSVGYHVAVVFTAEILDPARLDEMDAGVEWGREPLRRLLAGLPPANTADVRRLARLVRAAHEDQQRSRTDALAVESIGEQLAESYEEINYLYTIIQSMTVAQHPTRFVHHACRELLATMPYRWIGARFRRDHPWLRGLEGRFTMVGECAAAPRTVQALAERILETMEAGGPVVFEPGSNPRDVAYVELGETVIAHPVCREGQVIGVVIAGDKRGPDSAASSVDMKLLGATTIHMSIFLENAFLYEDLNTMFLGTLEALTASIDAKDRYTCGHSLRMAHLTQQLASAAGIDEQSAGRMRIAGLVHDVGKIGVPESVLTKPGRLTEAEFAWIRRHPEIGHRILKDIPQLSDILPGVLHHHERWDGRGYPTGLAGEEIPLVARMIALADSFDAMSSTRTYRASMSRDQVIAEIRDQAGQQFDPELAPLFVALDFGTFDELVETHRAGDVGPDLETGVAA